MGILRVETSTPPESPDQPFVNVSSSEGIFRGYNSRSERTFEETSTTVMNFAQPSGRATPLSGIPPPISVRHPHPPFYSGSTSAAGWFDGVRGMTTAGSDPITPPPTSATICPPLSSNASSSSSTSTSPPAPLCAGCRLRITDRVYATTNDANKWHTGCLKCVECGVDLESACYEREGMLFCKEDYQRLFYSRCFKCHVKLLQTDLVYRPKGILFHVDCFRCSTCNVNLNKGDLFGLHHNVPYCHLHHNQAIAESFQENCSGDDVGNNAVALTAGTMTELHSPPTDGEMYPLHQSGVLLPGMMGFPGIGDAPGPPPTGWYPPPVAGCPPPPAAQGNFPYDNNNEPRLKKQRGRKKRKVEAFTAMNGFLEAATASGSCFPTVIDGSHAQGKTKRARTSFKHHQLRIMKAHFQINQNPDSRELKMLSQKTQLDKKVLQVWFQNARAKWRRTKAMDQVAPNTNATATSSSSGATSSSNCIMMGGNVSMNPSTSVPEDSEHLISAGDSPDSDCSGGGAMITCC